MAESIHFSSRKPAEIQANLALNLMVNRPSNCELYDKLFFKIANKSLFYDEKKVGVIF